MNKLYPMLGLPCKPVLPPPPVPYSASSSRRAAERRGIPNPGPSFDSHRRGAAASAASCWHLAAASTGTHCRLVAADLMQMQKKMSVNLHRSIAERKRLKIMLDDVTYRLLWKEFLHSTVVVVERWWNKVVLLVVVTGVRRPFILLLK